MPFTAKNRINFQSTECEPREMLAAGNPNVVPGEVSRGLATAQIPDALEAQRIAFEGGIEIAVSGNRTFALVPSEQSELPRSGESRLEFLANIESQFERASVTGIRAATSTNSQGGRRITQSEANRIENGRIKALANALGGEAYIGQTGGELLYRVGDGPLPEAQRNGPADSILNLGFDESRTGDAANASELPNVIRLSPDAVRAAVEIGKTARTEGGFATAVLDNTGAIDSRFPVNSADDLILATVEEREAVENGSGIVVIGRPLDAINPRTGIEL